MTNKILNRVITNAGAFIREASISKLTKPADCFSLEFRSRLTSAKDPNAWQRNFLMLLERNEVEDLRALLDECLALKEEA